MKSELLLNKAEALYFCNLNYCVYRREGTGFPTGLQWVWLGVYSMNKTGSWQNLSVTG
jgi:hypothetical protein